VPRGHWRRRRASPASRVPQRGKAVKVVINPKNRVYGVPRTTCMSTVSCIYL
jgi:hypothetical protein